MNSPLARLLTLATLAATAAAQGPDFLVTFSQPERTLSGSGGTVLQSLAVNEVSHLGYTTMPCPVSAEKWAPRTAYGVMAGDENGNGFHWNPTLFGAIDALQEPMPVAGAAVSSPRSVFFSVTAPIGMNVSALPLRPGDVGRIVRNTFGDGQVEHFMRQEQFNASLGLPVATPIDVDAIAYSPNFGVLFSLDADIAVNTFCGPFLLRDGDVVCVPPAALAMTPDFRVAGVLAMSAVVVHTEAQMSAFVANAMVTNRFGACIPVAIDTESIEIDLFGPVTFAPTCTGVAIPVPALIFATESMTGASLLTTAFGGQIYATPCGLAGTPCGGGPTFGNQLGLMPPTAANGVPSYVNAIAHTRSFRMALEPQQHVLNVPFGAPAGATMIDYSSPWAFNLALIELVSPVVPGSISAFPFSQLCFPDLYAPSLLVHAWPLFGPFGSFPMVAIPPAFSGKILYQNLGFGGSGFELSTPAVVDVN